MCAILTIKPSTSTDGCHVGCPTLVIESSLLILWKMRRKQQNAVFLVSVVVVAFVHRSIGHPIFFSALFISRAAADSKIDGTANTNHLPKGKSITFLLSTPKSNNINKQTTCPIHSASEFIWPMLHLRDTTQFDGAKSSPTCTQTELIANKNKI